MSASVTVAIPTLNAGPRLRETLAAVRAQRIDRDLELLICDSGSTDETREIAREYGARIIEIPQAEFSHGGTRNLLMSRAGGEYVAFLTQDAVPVDDRWLAALLGAFTATSDVGLSFGPYRPPPGTSLSTAREIEAWFATFGGRRVDILEPADRGLPPRAFLGHRGYFTDANGCVARAAWERVPFRPVAYAEDHLLAQDMLRAGFAKVFVPEAAVLHAHDYSTLGWLRRSFDEARAVQEIYGFAESPRTLLRNLRGGVSGDVRSGSPRVLISSLAHHAANGAGAFLGSRSARLPRRVVRALSLERRA